MPGVAAAMVISLGTAALAASAATAATAEGDTVSLKQNVLDAYAAFAASDTGALIAQQGKMATPNVYLADLAAGAEETGATPAAYWYVRNGLGDDGVSLAPEAVLYSSLQNLKESGAITDFDFDLIANLGHGNNTSTDEALAWMDQILAAAGPSDSVDASDDAPGTGEAAWWDVTSYEGGTFEQAANGTVTESSDTGQRTLTVTLDGQPFTVTHYWGYYAADPNSPNQKISIYVPENVAVDSATYFMTNNAGWQADSFAAAMADGAEFTTGNLAWDSSQNSDFIAEMLDRGTIVVSDGARGRADAANDDGEYLGHSPATMTDTKAAIRFLKYNQVYGDLPGDPERVIVTGTSGGGGLTTTLAASGNSSDYFDSLAEIGALGLTQDEGGAYVNDEAVGDDVFATFSSCPIIDLFKADYATEWLYGATRQKVADGEYADAEGITNGRNAADRLAQWQNLASAVLAQNGYQDYIQELGLTVDGVQRTLLDMVESSLEAALNENASYKRDLVDVSAIGDAQEATDVLDTLLRYSQSSTPTEFDGLPLDWFTVSGDPGGFVVTIPDSAWDAFNEYMYWTAQWVKSPSCCDGESQDTGLGKTGMFNTGESTLWGTTSERYNHTNEVSWALDTANWPLFGVTASTLTDDAARQAENREIATTLFEVTSATPEPTSTETGGTVASPDPTQTSGTVPTTDSTAATSTTDDLLASTGGGDPRGWIPAGVIALLAGVGLTVWAIRRRTLRREG